MLNILGVDIGGTAIKLGIVSAAGEILARAECSVNFDGYQTPILHTALSCAASFLRENSMPVEGIGISATGQIDAANGVVVGTCGNLPGWCGTRLREAFEVEFARPTSVMNDANCAVLGESWVGAAKGYADVVMVTIGTGVGGGVLVGGKILHGAAGLGGELGHMPLRYGGLPCTCGNTGCFEQYASVTALLLGAQRRLGAHISGARALFQMAAEGDEAATALLSEWEDDIAAGLVGLVHLFNPELILLGGGVSRQSEWLVRPVRERVLRRIMPRFAQGLEVKAAGLGNDAGLIGAARFWLDENGAGNEAGRKMRPLGQGDFI